MMIQVKPLTANFLVCPECGANEPELKAVDFESIHVLGDCTCKACGFDFYQVLPVGHSVNDRQSIGKSNGKLYKGPASHDWLSESIALTHNQIKNNDVSIHKVIYKQSRNVIILNTLDSLYGHTLLKLYNALYHIDHDKDLGLIVIVPAIFEWLIPKGVAEAWIVDLKLSQLAFGYDAIRKFVAAESTRFDNIYLSKAFSHPDFSKIDISRLTGVRPFNLKDFSKRKPVVTFVLREDRWWFSGVADYWFYRACRRLKKLRSGSKILSRRQNKLVKKTIRQLRKKIPGITFNVVGLGTTGSFNHYAFDQRKAKVDTAIEREWCHTYARSHVVVGVHGSNMLLPTALAAGCVEILPEDRYGNMVQDISVRYADRLQLFFYRFADQYASPASVAFKIESMIRDFPSYHLNMRENVYGVEQL
ncbi:MAG TPA: hypothetical protein VG737_04265 [Cyclobacteriaceae bacterium]|nr:hypothetical protein [Cyclobacteriaceae bacterium]